MFELSTKVIVMPVNLQGLNGSYSDLSQPGILMLCFPDLALHNRNAVGLSQMAAYLLLFALLLKTALWVLAKSSALHWE